MVNFLQARPKQTLGIFISTRSIITVALRLKKDKPELVKYSIDKLPASLIPFDIHSENSEATILFLRELIKEKGLNTSHVVSTIPGETTLVRYFKMPKIIKKEEPAAVRYEARKYIPFKLDDITSDYQIINVSALSEEMDVLFAAIEKVVSEKFFSIFEKANVSLQALEIIPFALLRTFLLNGQLAPENFAAIIYAYDSENISINFVRNNFVYLSRDAHISPAGAPGFFESLSGEIRTSMHFCKSEFKCEAIDKIIICGEADFANWPENLKEEFGVPVEIGNPLKGLGISDPNSSKLAVALGLALRDMTAPAFNINLLPAQVSKKIKISIPRFKLAVPKKVLLIESALAVLVLITFWFIMSRAEMALRAGLKDFENRKPKIEAGAGPKDEKIIIKHRDKLIAKLTFLKNVMDGKIYWTKKLNAVPLYLPDGCWLTEIYFKEEIKDGKKITRQMKLKGEIAEGKNEFELVGKFAEGLRADKSFFEGFNELKLDSIQKEKRGEFTLGKFELSAFPK